MVIAVDFDGTCVTHDYPRIGKDIGAIPVLKRLVEEGHKLILYTMRSGKELALASAWFRNNKIELYAKGFNPEQHSWTWSNKCYAELYIDDAALGAPLIVHAEERPHIDWEAAELILEQTGVLQRKKLDEV